jgi:hypothetical protein
MSDRPGARAKRLLLAIILFGLAASAVSCSSRSGQRDADSAVSWSLPEEKAVENSGRSLSGYYVVREVKDEYLARNSSNKIGVRYWFNSDGSFKRQKQSSGVSEGSYVIGAGSEMVLYIERVAGEPVGAALVERYMLDERPDGTIILKYGSSGLITLTRG